MSLWKEQSQESNPGNTEAPYGQIACTVALNCCTNTGQLLSLAHLHQGLWGVIRHSPDLTPVGAHHQRVAIVLGVQGAEGARHRLGELAELQHKRGVGVQDLASFQRRGGEKIKERHCWSATEGGGPKEQASDPADTRLTVPHRYGLQHPAQVAVCDVPHNECAI